VRCNAAALALALALVLALALWPGENLRGEILPPSTPRINTPRPRSLALRCNPTGTPAVSLQPVKKVRQTQSRTLVRLNPPSGVLLCWRCCTALGDDQAQGVAPGKLQCTFSREAAPAVFSYWAASRIWLLDAQSGHLEKRSCWSDVSRREHD